MASHSTPALLVVSTVESKRRRRAHGKPFDTCPACGEHGRIQAKTKGSWQAIVRSRMSWFTYILECKDGSFYVGITNNVAERVREHNLGEGPAYTKARRPVKVVYTEKHANKFEARKREEQIKKWRMEKKLALIRGLSRVHRGVYPESIQGVYPELGRGVYPELGRGVYPERSEGP